MFGEDPMMPLVVVASFVAIAGVGWALTAPSGARAPKKRVQAAGAQARLRGKRQNAVMDPTAQRRKQVQETLKDLEERQRAERKKSLTLKSRIEQAGFDFTPQTFWLASLGVAVVFFAVLFLTGRPLYIAAAGAFVGGFGLPRWFLGSARKRRLKKFSAEFANSIDVIVRGVKSGLPLNECLKIIAAEAPEPLRTEFLYLVEGQSVGVSLEDGLRKMYERMPAPELNFFGTVLAIQQKTGGNLSEALNNLSAVLRSRKLMREKIQALSSEAKASALIIGSLPPGVMGIVYFTTPSYISLMFTEPLGKMMLLGGALWMATGVFVMKRMVSFKI